MAVFNSSAYGAGVFGYFVPLGEDVNTPPTKPVYLDLEPVDGSDRTPVFSWLSSLDDEDDLLSYEVAVFDTSGMQMGSAMVSGIDLPESALSSLRGWGIDSPSSLSALSAMSAYVTGSWFNELIDGSYNAYIRAYDGELYSGWSDALAFYINTIDPPVLTLVPKHGKIELNWINPPDADFEKTIIAYSILDYPNVEAEYLQGTIVEDYNDPSSVGSFVHSNLINGIEYYYSAASYDADGNMAVIQKSAVPIPATSVMNFTATEREGAIILMWDNPTMNEFPNFNGVLVKGSSNGYPETPNDGETLFEGIANNYLHENLTNGQSYYYSVWTFDTFGEYIEPKVTATAIPIDITAPTGNLVINKGDVDTYAAFIDLSITAVDTGSGVTEMMLSNYSDFRDARYEPYNRKKEWVLLYEEGIRYVYLKLKDAFDNESEAISASINFRFDWVDSIVNTKGAIVGMSEESRYGVGMVVKSDKSIGLWADGEESDLFLYRRRIKTKDGEGVIYVDGKKVYMHRVYTS